MRGIAIGRKNYLFAGSDSGGDRAAANYTLVQTAKLNDVNPEAYLRDILAKIAAGHPIKKSKHCCHGKQNLQADLRERRTLTSVF